MTDGPFSPFCQYRTRPLRSPPTGPDVLDFFHEGGSIEEVPLNRTLIKASKSRGQRIRVSSVGRSVRWKFVDA